MKELASLASGSSDEPPDAQECDPGRRYWRFDKILGRGAFKTVYKALDEREGIEVAWNKVALGGAVQEKDHRDRLFAEISVLKRLKHKNIMTFYDYWLDEKSNTLNFITELFTDGSLRKFRLKHKHLELKVVKKWAWQILQGLVYLHGHEPPIIHRDLKCDNIFINGVSGVLKIGDLGLATLWKGLTAPHSVLGTPEFMAPEYYNEKYDEKVDVYAFGMLLLELVTMEYPYCECSNPAAIYKKVSQGVYPGSLQKVRTQELRDFIELCIQHEPEKRIPARKLLKHPFFDCIRAQMDPRRLKASDGLASFGSAQSSEGDQDLAGCGSGRLLDNSSCEPSTNQRQIPEAFENFTHIPNMGLEGNMNAGLCSAAMPWTTNRSGPNPSPFVGKAHKEGQNFSIQCSKADGNNLFFNLRFQDGDGKKTIQFPFNLNDDTAEQIVAEMLEEHSRMNLSITDEEADLIGHMIAAEVERSRNEGSEELTAYVHVHRAEAKAPEPSIPKEMADTSPAHGGEMETIVDNIMGDLATNPTDEEDLVRTLSERTGDILDVMMSKGDRMLVGCMPPRRASLLPVIHEDNQDAGSVQLMGVSQDSIEIDDEPVDGADQSEPTVSASAAVDIGTPAEKGPAVGPVAVARPSIPAHSPPRLAHFRSLSDKGALARWHRTKSEAPDYVDDMSPLVDRVCARRSCVRPFPLTASFRKEFIRSDELDEASDCGPQDSLETGSSGRFSPRSDGQFATSVSLYLLQQKGRFQDAQECGAKKKVAEEVAPQCTENPDGRMTAISMVLLKPPAANGGVPPPQNTPTKLEKAPDKEVDIGIEASKPMVNLDSLHTPAYTAPVSPPPVTSSPSQPVRTGLSNWKCGQPSPKPNGIAAGMPAVDDALFAKRPMLDPNLVFGGATSGTTTPPPLTQDMHVVGAPSPPLSIGMLERSATPPLIGVGQAHLFEPPVSWASVPVTSGIEQQNLIDTSAAQRFASPAHTPGNYPMHVAGVKSRPDDLSDSRASPLNWQRSVSTVEGMDFTGTYSSKFQLPMMSSTLTVSNSVPLPETSAIESLFHSWGPDVAFPPRVSAGISTPMTGNGFLSGVGGGATAGEHTRSSSGHSLQDLLGARHNFPGLAGISSGGDGEPASIQIGSSRSSSPSGDASPPAAYASSNQKASRKIVDKELRHKQAAQKMKEMEAQQLEVLSLGFGHGRSMTRSKPLRPTLNG